VEVPLHEVLAEFGGPLRRQPLEFGSGRRDGLVQRLPWAGPSANLVDNALSLWPTACTPAPAPWQKDGFEFADLGQGPGIAEDRRFPGR